VRVCAVYSCDRWWQAEDGAIEMRGTYSGVADGKRFVVLVRPLSSRGIKTITIQDRATGIQTTIPNCNGREWSLVKSGESRE